MQAPLSIQFAVALLGLGLPKVLLDRFAPRLSEFLKWGISSCILLLAVTGDYGYTAYLQAPRHLSDWQKHVLERAAKQIGNSVMVDVDSAPGDTEAYDYANEIVTVLAPHMAAGHGGEVTSSQYKVLHRGTLVVNARPEEWLENKGLTLFVVDANRKPIGAVRLMEALTSARLETKWGSDPMLSDTHYGGLAAPLIQTCLLYVGPKPSVSVVADIWSLF